MSASTRLPPRGVRFSTQDVPPAQRASFWRDAICTAFVGLELDVDRGVPFRSALWARALPHGDCMVVDGSAQQVRRTERLLEAEPRDSLIVMRQHGGSGLAMQDDRSMPMPPGALTWLDSRRPYALRFTGAFVQAVLKVPVSELVQRIGRHGVQPGQFVDTGHGPARLAALAIDELAREPDEAVAARLSSVAVDLLALSLAQQSQVDAPVSALRVTWARAHVLDHLSDPTLTPGAVARAQGVSLRLLERLFAAEGQSLSAFILGQRLQRCAQALRDAAQARRTITDIALGWGFNDPAYFARAFRRHLGVSPRDWREGAAGRDA